MGKLFIETVARNRNLKASVVRGTQAGTFLGAAGVEIGFADAVRAPNAAMADLLRSL
jgi:ClpP class serine protease